MYNISTNIPYTHFHMKEDCQMNHHCKLMKNLTWIRPSRKGLYLHFANGVPVVSSFASMPCTTPVKASMFIATDFKNSRERTLGESTALDAIDILKEGTNFIACLYFNANENASYVCDYNVPVAIKERVRKVLKQNKPVNKYVKDAIVELLIKGEIVRLNSKGRPQKTYGLNSPSVLYLQDYF